MKTNTTYNRAVQYLNKVFKLVNHEFFDDELDIPTITIQSSVGAYGHVTTSKVWTNERGEATYELNLGAEYLTRPIENIVATLIHEGVHIYCMENGIKDTSNHGVYHNKNFKIEAEKRGLIIDRHDKYGWTITSPDMPVIDFCIANGLTDIEIARNSGFSFTGIGTGSNGGTTPPKAPKKPSSTRKYICPCCGNSFRATKSINVLCMDCNEPFVVVS